MNTTEIPFNKYVGISKPQNQDIHLLELATTKHHENHLGTIHASAQFALAEACSGEYLLKTFVEHADHIVPVDNREAPFVPQRIISAIIGVSK